MSKGQIFWPVIGHWSIVKVTLAIIYRSWHFPSELFTKDGNEIFRIGSVEEEQKLVLTSIKVCGITFVYHPFFPHKSQVFEGKPTLNSSEHRLTFLGSILGRDCLKILLSCEKFFGEGQDVKNLSTFSK